MTAAAVDVVLFDLDGTLMDSATSILAALAEAFEAHGVPPLPPEVARGLLGPPFATSLPPLVGADLVAPIVTTYRQIYRTTMLTARPFDGILAVLSTLRARGVRLAVATSKPEVHARTIVENAALAEFFEVIGGDELDGSRGTKALVIDSVLERLGRPPVATVRMVGDREHDVEGARAHGIACVGVQWGYANAGELAAARPSALCAAPGDLVTVLLPDGDRAH